MLDPYIEYKQTELYKAADDRLKSKYDDFVEEESVFSVLVYLHWRFSFSVELKIVIGISSEVEFQT